MRDLADDIFEILYHPQPSELIWQKGEAILQGQGVDGITLGTALRDAPQSFSLRTNLPTLLIDDYFREEIHLKVPWMELCQHRDNIPEIDVAEILRHPHRDEFPIAEIYRAYGVLSAKLFPCHHSDGLSCAVFYASDPDGQTWLRHVEGLRCARLIASALAYACGPATEPAPTARDYATYRRLSARERECLKWLASGLLTARIADRMGIAEITVRKHLASARQKLGAKSREQTLVYAIVRREIQL